MYSVYLHGSVWLEVDCVLIHHEPAQGVITIVGRKSDSGLTVINVPEERIYHLSQSSLQSDIGVHVVPWTNV
jgi:hypothetical protein